jgi:transposase-like protein
MAMQRSQASLSQLSREQAINPKTVAKCRKWATIEDMKTGPKEPRSTVLTEAEEAAILALRRHTRERHELCVSGLAHTDFRHGQALKRSSKIVAS